MSRISVRPTPIWRTPKALASLAEGRKLANPGDCTSHFLPFLSSVFHPTPRRRHSFGPRASDDDRRVGCRAAVRACPARGRQGEPGQRGPPPAGTEAQPPAPRRLPDVERPHPHAHGHRGLLRHPSRCKPARRRTNGAHNSRTGGPALKFKMSSASQPIGPRSVMTSRDSPRAARRGGSGRGRRGACPQIPGRLRRDGAGSDRRLCNRGSVSSHPTPASPLRHPQRAGSLQNKRVITSKKVNK